MGALKRSAGGHWTPLARGTVTTGPVKVKTHGGRVANMWHASLISFSTPTAVLNMYILHCLVRTT